MHSKACNSLQHDYQGSMAFARMQPPPSAAAQRQEPQPYGYATSVVPHFVFLHYVAMHQFISCWQLFWQRCDSRSRDVLCVRGHFCRDKKPLDSLLLVDKRGFLRALCRLQSCRCSLQIASRDILGAVSEGRTGFSVWYSPSNGKPGSKARR